MTSTQDMADWEAWLQGRRMPSDLSLWEKIKLRVTNKEWWVWQISAGNVTRIASEFLALVMVVCLATWGVTSTAFVATFSMFIITFLLTSRLTKTHVFLSGGKLADDVDAMKARWSAAYDNLVDKLYHVESVLRDRGNQR